MAVKALKLDPADADLPKIETMKVEDVIAAVLKTKGDAVVGAQIFAQATCNNCHTVRKDVAQKGPYLGNIAETYKRPELAEAILNPNKTLAQGFVANHFELKDGTEVDGFVVREAADQVTVRTIAAAEMTVPVAQIVKRERQDRSLMPEGLAAGLTVGEFASLLDYLEQLSKSK